MKKVLYLSLLALMTLLIISVGAAFAISNEDEEIVTVTFKVEFTTPVEFLDGYEVFGKDSSYSIKYDKDSVLQDIDIPLIGCIGDAIFEGWDNDPHNYTVTEDITFTAKINNDGTIPAFFKAVNENGKPFGCLAGVSIADPDNYMVDQDHFVSFVKKGEKLEDGVTVPIVSIVPDGEYVYVPDGFTPDPVGYVMNEPEEFICTSKPVLPENVPQYTVTYKVEFTSDMTIPDEYSHSLLSFDTHPYLPNSVIEQSHVPTIRFLGDGMTFEGWDKEPVGTIVTGNMTFTAKFNNDGGVPIFFKSIDEDGEAIKALTEPTYSSEPRYYRTYITVVKEGEALTAENIPAISNSLGYVAGGSWDSDPIGYVAAEPHEFTFTYKYYYRVLFVAELAELKVEQYVHRGEAAEAPEVPESDSYLFIGWDKDFSKITKELTVNALMYRYGDANMDNVINTADAVQILRHCVGLTTLESNAFKLADVNGDTKVNTLDAVKVLRIVAGLDQL